MRDNSWNFHKPKSTYNDKILWLLMRPELWKALPAEAPYYAYETEYVRLFNLMRDAKLFSRNTGPASSGIVKLVTEARERIARIDESNRKDPDANSITSRDGSPTRITRRRKHKTNAT